MSDTETAEYWAHIIKAWPLAMVFTAEELTDIMAAATERRRSVHRIIHDAVMEALYS